jgi:MFS family permease
MFAQREFAPRHYGAVVTRIWSIGQVMYAFGPIGAGLLLTATGTPAWPLLACMVCQLVAAGLCFARPAKVPLKAAAPVKRQPGNEA